ncbi:MAG: TIGR00730 family Rossman fold protein [Parcubacteria group bacterium]|nr:TIGR00730 family Rossman fold protein [Parcubacteria group bacterium]
MPEPKFNLPASKLPVHKHGDKGDFRESFHWRVSRITAEFVEGFQFLFDFKKTVTFFGSARFQPDNSWYQEAEKLAGLLAKEDFTVITGGGPGIMEAGNKGAAETGGESVGINIQLEKEQRINPYVKRSIGLHYFFTRKVMLSYSAWAYVFFPGGFGTLDEFFELVTLVQTQKINAGIPIVIVGRDYWTGLLDWVDKTVFKKNLAIDKEDMKIYTLVDTAAEAFNIIKNCQPREEF